jgi:hypothetical protein
MATTCFVLLDKTTTPPSYGAVTPDVLQLIATALEAQATDDFCPEYGGSVVVRVGASPTDIASGEVAVNIVDDLSAIAPGAAAYHDDESGMPVINVAADEFDSFVGPSSMPMSTGISHEMLETLGDAGANRWADRPDGSEEALEECDRLQGTDYQKTLTTENADGSTSVVTVQVANFLLPSAWIPGAAGPWDFGVVLQNQYDVTPGGYVITRKQGAGSYMATQPPRVGFSGEHVGMSGKTLERKRHPSSRTSRRGAIL